MKFILLALIITLSSCASYVQSLHRQIDNEQRKNSRQRTKQIRNNRDARPIQNPTTLGNYPTASSSRNYNPNSNRQYQSRGTRRHKASDLVDNQGDGSLWTGKNSESFLFVTNNLKNKGDIVIVQVMEDLKNKIQEELKRNFPAPKVKNKKSKRVDSEPKKDEAAPATAAPKKEGGAGKIHDKISTAVVEQVNQDYLLIRGRKEVMFRKFKRYFEIQALVSQKDITSQDTVSSDKLLETKIKVLRY
jgi:flagellar basal body L-ring protein FlgH